MDNDFEDDLTSQDIRARDHLLLTSDSESEQDDGLISSQSSSEGVDLSDAQLSINDAIADDSDNDLPVSQPLSISEEDAINRLDNLIQQLDDFDPDADMESEEDETDSEEELFILFRRYG